MENRDIKKIVLYFILYRLMDLEEILWNIADFIIKPVALTRKSVMNKLGRDLERSKVLEVKE